jgi:cytoskeletal protein CcmA (bactofilin family)
VADITTFIAAGTSVSGRIEGAESIEIHGVVDGAIQLQGDVLVDEKAHLNASVDANSVDISGVVVGNIVAQTRVHVHASAAVVGDISAPVVVIDDGARYRGFVDMGDLGVAAPAPAPSTATPASVTVSSSVTGSEVDEPEAPETASKKRVRVKKRA